MPMKAAAPRTIAVGRTSEVRRLGGCRKISDNARQEDHPDTSSEGDPCGVRHRRAWILLISCMVDKRICWHPKRISCDYFYCPMRILLIGGNGFIGRFAVRALKRQGHALAVFHRGTTAAPAGVEKIRGYGKQLSGCAHELKR